MHPDTLLPGLPLAFVDCEATGYAGPDAHVVEVAVVHGTFGSDDRRVAFHTHVRPPVPIPESSTRVHGLTDADVASAPTWAEVWPAVEEALAGRLPVAYGAPADYRYIATEQERIGAWPLPGAWTAQRWLDLLVVRRGVKTRGRPGKLLEVAAEHGIALDAHGATGDAIAVAMISRQLLRAAVTSGAFASPAGAQPRGRYDRGDEPQARPCPRTVGQLLDWVREAALHQERSYAEYRRDQGDLAPPQCPWHALEGVAAPTWGGGDRTARCPTCSAPTKIRVTQAGTTERVNPDGSPHVCGV